MNETQQLPRGEAEQRLRFEGLISATLAGFLNASDTRLDSEFTIAIRRLVELLGFDGGTLFQFGADASLPVATHSWAEPQCRQVEIGSSPWDLSWLRRGSLAAREVIPSNADDLDAHDQKRDAFCRKAGIKRLIALPLTVGDRSTGVLVLTSEKDKTALPVGAERQLRVIANIFAVFTERMRRKLELQERAKFETLVADLSVRFIHLPAEHVDSLIADAQRLLCESLGLDRSVLCQRFEQEPAALLLTHFFQREGFLPPPMERRTDPKLRSSVYWVRKSERQPYQPFDLSSLFPWTYEQLKNGEPVIFSSPDDLPEVGRDRELYRRFGTQSSVVLPLATGGRWLGCLSFSGLRKPREWPEELVKRFQIVARYFANALARKRADEALRESEEHLAITAEAGEVGLWDMQLDTGQIWVTPRMRSLMQFAPDEELTFAKFLEAVHPEDRGLILQSAQQAFESGVEMRVEHRVVLPDDSIRWISGRGRQRCDSTGKPQRLTGASVDITERKRVEETLRQNEERLRLVLEANSEGVWDWNLPSGQIYFSPRYLEMLGYTAEEFAKDYTSWEKLVHPDDRQSVRKADREQLLGSKQLCIEFRMRKKSGDWCWVRRRATVVEKDPEGRPLRMLGTHLDITSQKEAEKRVQESEQRFLLMANSAPVLIWVAAPNKLCTFFNDPWLTFTGRTLEQELGNGWAAGVHPDDLNACLKTYEESFDARCPFSMEYRLRRHDGQYRWMLDNGIARYDSEQNFVGYIGSCVDITDRKRAEQGLMKSEERFRQVAETVADFIRETDADGLYTYTSPSLEKILGYAPEELIGKKHFYDLFAPAVREELKAVALQVVAARQSFRAFATVNLSKDGRLVHLEKSGMPISEETGKLVGYRGAGIDVTERLRAQAKLGRSEQKFRNLHESIREAFACVDMSGRFQEFNSAFQELLGYSEQELRSLTFQELTPEKWRKSIAAILRDQVLARGHSNVFEKEYRRKDGTIFPAELRVFLTRNDAGAPEAMWAIVRDISERKAAERILRQNEERLRLVMEANSEGVWDWQIPSGQVYFSPRYLEMLGYSSGEFAKDYASWERLVHPDDRQRVCKVDQEHLRNSRQLSSEFRLRKKTGDWCWIRSRGTVVETDSQGRPIRMVGTHLDITREKQAEKRALESEQRFLLMANSAPVLIWAAGTDKGCTFVNKAWLDFTGHTLEQELGEGWAEGIHVDDRERCLKAYIEAFDARHPFSMDYRLRRYDGQYRWVSDHGIAHFDSDKNFAGYIGTCVDITDRKQAEAETEDARQKLAHMSRVATLGELTGSLAHELNQPLTAILSNAQAAQRLLANGRGNQNELHNALEAIAKQDLRAAEVISRMRSMLKKGEAEMLPLEINSLIREVLGLVHSDLAVRNVVVGTQLAPRLPLVLGDRVQLQQVVLNLIMNACDALSATLGPKHKVTINTKPLRGRVQVAVSDSGPGFSPEMLKQPFERFRTTKPHGLGLGLPICLSIINAHRGRLWLANGKDGGATVRFTLAANRKEKP